MSHEGVYEGLRTFERSSLVEESTILVYSVFCVYSFIRCSFGSCIVKNL